MTILLATRRDTSVVIAADRLWYGGNGSGTTTKIVTHPRLPLAMASGGFFRLPVGGKAVRVTELLDGVMAGLTVPSQLDMHHVMRLVAARLHPPLLALLADPGLAAEPAEKQQVAVYVGLVARNRAQLGRLVLTGDATAHPDEPGLVSAPASLAAHFTTGPYADGDALFAPTVTNPERIAARFRDTIAGAVDAEARLYGGKNVEVGGGVDVAIVRTGGARLY